MSQVVRLFHGSQIVEDVLAVGRLYHDFFGSWVYEAQHLRAEGSVNSANLMGGTFSMEMLAPLDRDADTAEARFLRRHGPHFNNIAFWVRDCRGLVERLLAHGVRVALRGRGVVDRLDDEPFDYAITHPKDTCGSVLELLEDRPIHDPRHMSWWSDTFWREHHPLGIEGLSHCTIAVRDLDGATRFYADVLGCPLVHEQHDGARGAHSRFFAVGDTLVELAVPLHADSELARHLHKHGPITYAFTFKVPDLARVADHARKHTLTTLATDAHTLELDRAQTFTGIWAFTDRVPPGHPSPPRAAAKEASRWP